MKPGRQGFVVILLLCAFVPAVVHAQAIALSGRITDSSGKPVSGAKVSVKNGTTGQTQAATTDENGAYHFAELASGSYQVSISAAGFSPQTSTAEIKPGVTQTLNATLSAESASQLPNAPAPNPTEPSLSDLGFNPAQTQADPAEQARLDKRSHMLKIHQRLGLITTIPLVATVITGTLAGGKATSSSNRDLHAALGSVTAGLYLTTASYAIFAPKIEGTRTRGPIRVHKALAWIHGPGMILTPILGVMAFEQKSRGEKVHGLASAHGPVAIVTAGAYGAALLSVSMKF
jgi:hypothetical protein